jgi:protein SCO1/2
MMTDQQTGCLMMLIAAVLLPSRLATAQVQRSAPEQLDGVGVSERLDEPLPLATPFLNSRGDEVALGEFFSADRPVILSLTYTSCPMLCHLQLEGLVQSLRNVSLNPGEDFEIVNISIDPQESPRRARETRQKHLRGYGRPGIDDGWHFLVGKEASIREVADAVGFQYRWIPERNEYAHAAAIMICTPDGRVSRYLYGVRFPDSTLRLSLIEASKGRIGSSFDQLLLFCFHYDAATGKYSPMAFRIVQVGGCLTLAALLIGLVPYWLRSRRGSASVEAPERQEDDSAEPDNENQSVQATP